MWLILSACTSGLTPLDPDATETTASPIPACDLDIDGPTEVLEGETFEVRLRCGDAEGFHVELLGLPGGATWEGSSGTLSWATHDGDAGRHRISATVLHEDPRVVPYSFGLDLDVTDDWGTEGNLPPDPRTYWREFGTPVVHLFPDGPLTQDDGPGTVWVEGRQQGAELKIRGASSAGYPKPGLTIEVDDELDLRAWGLGEPNHLVLVSTFDDNSYVRQKLCYDLWAEMAQTAGSPRLTPRTAFVTVYLDGAYHGLFVAIDRIDDRFLKDMGLEEGGNLYKAVNHDANFRATNAGGGAKSSLHDGYTQEEGESTDFADLDGLVGFTAGATPESFALDGDQWVDPSEFIDWYLFVRFAAADDSGGKNSYLYKDPVGGRFRYVPWDFNHSWGQDWRTLRVPSDVANDFRWANNVFALLQDDPAGAAAIDARWEALALGPFGEDRLLERSAAYRAATEPAARRDWAKWGPDYAVYGGWSWGRGADLQDYDGEGAYLDQWLVERAAWAQGPGRP